MHGLQASLLGLAAVSTALYLAMIVAFAVAMRRPQPQRKPTRWPRVSILKPLAGVDDDLEGNLASFAELDCPDYEILLGVASADDPAYPLARKFVKRAGSRRARLIVTDPDAAINPKVVQLIALEQAASGEVIMVSDSNVRVTPGYLQRVVAELSSPGVAAVSSVFAGSGERTLGAALENLQLNAFNAPAVVAAFALGHTITVGKSMVMWREALRRIGGFSSVADFLSDDHLLGRAFAQAGYAVHVSLLPVDNRNVSCSVKRMIGRHTRWAQIRRALSPLAFALEPALSPLVIATLAFLASPAMLPGLALVGASVVQAASAMITVRVLRGRGPRWYWAPLEVLRSYLLFYCWLRACASRQVAWRGHVFQLARDSRIVPAEVGARDRVHGIARA
jgi:ceramide glucosyltransferase